METLFVLRIFGKEFTFRSSVESEDIDDSPETSGSDDLIADDRSETSRDEDAANNYGECEVILDKSVTVGDDEELSAKPDNHRYVGFSPNPR